MGNVLQKQVYPGGLVSNAQPHLEGRGYEVHEQYALLHRDNWERNVTVVFFHGNLEDVSRTADTWAFLRAVETIGFEYPGYGWRAREVPSQHALLAEVPFQADFVTKTSEERGVILIGRSLGTFAALNLAVALGPEKCIGVVLISPLLTAVATKVPPPFHRAFGLIDYADNESLAPRLDPNIPVFVAHGESDIVVPLSNAKELWKGFPLLCRREFLTVKAANHNDVLQKDEVKDRLLAFIDSLTE